MAAAHAFHLAESQAFIDGNKRTGMAAALAFLRIHVATVPRSRDGLYTPTIEIAERYIGKPELATLLRRLNGRG